ncbi:hypothetical protein X975_06277, partial [Stegodyphus mimosarum]
MNYREMCCPWVPSLLSDIPKNIGLCFVVLTQYNREGDGFLTIIIDQTWVSHVILESDQKSVECNTHLCQPK